MAAIFQNGYQNYHRNPEAGIFLVFSMYLDMQYIKFYFLTSSGSNFALKISKWPPFSKWHPKSRKVLIFQSILP